MMDFQQKRKVRKALYSRITIFLLLIAVIFLARATYHIYTTEKISAENYASVLKNYNNLETQKAALRSEINKLSTESGQEEEIRSKFSVAKPNEAVVLVINGTSSNPASSTNQNTSLWQKFLNLFK